MSELRQLKASTRGLLRELGDSPESVAHSLGQAGVQGVPRDNRSCAVALYVAAILGADPRVRSVRVGHCSVLIDTVSTSLDRPTGKVMVQLPKPVRRFVAQFDALAHPEVTREGPATGHRPSCSSSGNRPSGEALALPSPT